MRTLFTMPALIMSVALTTGCSEKSSEPATQPIAPAAAAAGDHHHGAAPHGGTITDWGGGVYHVEYTVDHDAKSATVYILGSDAKSPEPVKADKLLLTINDPAFQVELNADPLADESGGMSSRFVGIHENLGIVRESAGTISGEVEGTPYVGEFSEVAGDHGHEHSTPHEGVVAALKDESGSAAGFVELKLHDDKGDLELWLAKDNAIAQPLDIPADSVINVSFKDLPGKTTTLKVRNNQQNEDEDGTPNRRNGKTNYFIFPGDSGQDASWLVGAEFKSAVTVWFDANGQTYTSEEFVLVPHTHAAGEGHAHPH